MFAQSRFVFMAGPEGPKDNPMQALENMAKLEAEEVNPVKVKKEVMAATKAINAMPDGTQKVEAMQKLAQLKNKLDEKVKAAEKAVEDENWHEARALKNVETALEAQAKALIVAKQMGLRNEIAKAKEPLDKIVNGDVDEDSVDQEFVKKVEGLESGLYAIETVDVKKTPKTLVPTEIDAWADKLSADIKTFSTAGEQYGDAYRACEMRRGCREKAIASSAALSAAYEYAMTQDAGEGSLKEGANVAVKELAAIQEPGVGSPKEVWDKYVADKAAVVAKFNVAKEDYMNQVRKDRDLKEFAKQKIDEIKTQLEGTDEEKPNNSEPVKAAAEAALKRAQELADGSQVGPTFGNVEMANNIDRARNDLESKYNTYAGELTAQQMNEVASEGNSDAVSVYADFKDGKFKTFAEFSKAFDEALAKDKAKLGPKNRYAVVSEDAKARVAALEDKAAALRQIAQQDLQLQETKQFLADAATTIKEGYDTLIGGLGKMAAEGEVLLKEQERLKAADKTRYEAAAKSLSDAKASLDGKRGAAVKKAMTALNKIGTLMTPEDHYKSGEKPGELTYEWPIQEAQRVMDQYEQDSAREARVAAARRKATREAAAKGGVGVEFKKDPTTGFYRGDVSKIGDTRVDVDLGEKPKREYRPIGEETASGDGLNE